MEILNKSQVTALFQRESALIGTADAVPIFRATALFGKDAIKYVKSLTFGSYWNCCAAGDFTLIYLTYRGFLAAASFCNMRQLQSEETRS